MGNHFKNNTAWRAKWEKMDGRRHTGEIYHTWHESKDTAFIFVIKYVESINPNAEHFQPISTPKEHENLLKQPYGVFLESKVITLAPLA